jgi:hypothetical protein
MVQVRCGMGSMTDTAGDDRQPHDGVTAYDGATRHEGVNGHDETAIRRALLQALAAIEGPRERVDGIPADDDTPPGEGEPGDQEAAG